MKRFLFALVLVGTLATLPMVRPAAAAAVGTAFTYQGQLQGVAANAVVNLQFKLYDDPTLSTGLIGTQTVSNVTLESGLFTVSLDFGGSAFAGSGRWLEIAVKGPGDPGFTTLTPRQAMTVAPYALYALSSPGGGGGLTLPFAGATPNATQDAFRAQNDAASTSYSAIHGVSATNASGNGTIFGEAIGTSGFTLGVQGLATASPSGTGVVGKGGATGAYFESGAPNSFNSYAAVYAYAPNTYAVNAQSPNSYGVWASGGADGVHGTGANAGVYGVGTQYGVVGDSYNGFGVYATYGLGLTPASGANAGVYGSTSSTNAASAGVRGQGDKGIGVEGISASGYGVSGTTSIVTKAGVYGTSAVGDGVWGQTGAAFKSGIVGISYNASGYGGAFFNQAGGPAILVSGLAQVKTLQILGADLAESFPTREKTIEPGTVLMLDDGTDGQLRVCREAYSRRVAGVVSGAHGLDAGVVLKGKSFDNPEHAAVALSGRVWVKCDATDAPIHAGDLLTTSATPGHAMQATDHDRAYGAILGKAMTSLEKGTGLVLVLVSLQ
jgi:hypothetical protein